MLLLRNIIFLVLLGVAGAFLWKNVINPPAKSAKQQLIDRDLNALKDPDAKPRDIQGALLRMGSMKMPQARERAYELSTDSSAFIRGAAARALGYFADAQSLENLKKLLQDAEMQVRIEAIRAIATLKDETRRDILEKYLAQANLHEQEKIETLGRLLFLTSVMEKQTEYMTELKRYWTSLELRKDLSFQALRLAMSQDARSPILLDWMKKSLEENQFSHWHYEFIRHLGAIRDPWLKSNLEKVIFTRQIPLRVRVAAIHSLHAACPENRWEILDKLVKESDVEVVTAALEAAYRISDSGTQPAFQRWKPKASEAMQKKISSLESKIDLGRYRGCAEAQNKT